MTQSVDYKKLDLLLTELKQNIDLYGDMMEGYELMQYLVGWMTSFKNYSDVSTQAQKAKYVNALIDQLQRDCQGGREYYKDQWKIPTEPLPSDGLLGDLTEALIEKNKYLDEPDPDNPGD